MNTKRQAKIEWMKQIEIILNKMLKDYDLSPEFQTCEPEEKFFSDSCKFSSLRHEIFELKFTLKNMQKYMLIIEEEESK